MSSNPFAAYQETKVLSASPVQLIHLAYEGAIEAIAEARGHLAGKRIHERARAITRVQLILTELQSSLDFNKGGDVSVQLDRLYDYMQRRLMEANFKQIEEPLAEVQGLLETLGSAWKEIAATGTTVLQPAPIAAGSFTYGDRPDSPLYGRVESAYSYTGYTL
ncbi:MAG: flagellar export chaperone FliS [Acidobacteriota bacterium]|nr:flagellar export chaperone FliS [Acidobacteriota bacterium]